MNADLEGDVLFQINAIVWASMPLAAQQQGTYYPALYNHGYVLANLEYPLRPTPGELARMNATSLQITQTPVADIVLRTNTIPAKFILIEAKRSSFGASGDGRVVRQARGLVFASGNAAARVGAVGLGRGHASYLVPLGDGAPMGITVTEIRSQLGAAGLNSIGDTSVLTLSVREDGVWLTSSAAPQQGSGGEALFQDELLILARDADPRPLYIVPWHPDCDDPVSERIFAQKAKTRFVGALQEAPIGSSFIDYRELLSHMSSGIYDAWRDQDTMNGRLVPALRAVIQNLRDAAPNAIGVQNAGVDVRVDTEEARETIIEAVSAVRVGASDTQGFQPPLQSR